MALAAALITALVAAATVYNVVAVVAAGFDCPKTLYVVAIKFLYPPINKNGLNVSAVLTLPEAFLSNHNTVVSVGAVLD